MINKYYFINKYETNNIDKLDKHTSVIYRNYKSKVPKITTIMQLKKYCRSKKIKFYLSNDIKIAIKLNLDGVYLPSFNKSTNHLAYSLKKSFDILGSAHSIKEIKIKEKQKANKIFLSSIFKKNKNYLGLYRFKLISKLTSKEIVALGGISKKNLKKLNLLRNKDFAGISYFE